MRGHGWFGGNLLPLPCSEPGFSQINHVVSHPTQPVTITAHDDRGIRFLDNRTGRAAVCWRLGQTCCPLLSPTPWQEGSQPNLLGAKGLAVSQSSTSWGHLSHSLEALEGGSDITVLWGPALGIPCLLRVGREVGGSYGVKSVHAGPSPCCAACHLPRVHVRASPCALRRETHP